MLSGCELSKRFISYGTYMGIYWDSFAYRNLLAFIQDSSLSVWGTGGWIFPGMSDTNSAAGIIWSKPWNRCEIYLTSASVDNPNGHIDNFSKRSQKSAKVPKIWMIFRANIWNGPWLQWFSEVMGLGEKEDIFAPSFRSPGVGVNVAKNTLVMLLAWITNEKKNLHLLLQRL